ncbi:hypothetical protein ABPG75_004953 [Micractinium tetrahymenae]
MQRQAVQQAGRLARATLVGAVSWGPRSMTAGLGIAVEGPQVAASCPAATAGLEGSAAAAVAALQSKRGLHGWAAPPPQQGGVPSAARQQSSLRQQQEQQRGMAGAQTEPSTSSSEAAGAASSCLGISDAAVQRLKELQAQSGGPVALRVTVEGGGCSGFQYEFAIEEGPAATAELAETDRLFERDGVRVLCDDISLEFLKGATVDFESDLMRSAFVVSANPNAASSCGCGSSFVAK